MAQVTIMISIADEKHSMNNDNTLHRLRDNGQGEIESVKAKLEEGSEAHASLEEEMKSRDADIRTLQASCAHLPFCCYHCHQ